MTSYHGQISSSSSSRPRNKVVKPILRKFTASEKNSLDLDRPAAEQQLSNSNSFYDYGTGNRSANDVVFSHSTRRGYHNRSTSGTSQFSTATGGSNRAGSFVHPFAQTPRPYTPPLASSYQNSLRESDNSDGLAINTEDDPRHYTIRQHSGGSITMSGPASPTIPTLRIQTKQSSSRLALATSNANLHEPDIASPTENMSPGSLRPSIDKGFRIRSRSENDPRGRAESIQEARRKFQEREQAKDEKAAREEIRQMEKRNQKEARAVERHHRRSSASEAPTRSKRSRSDLTKTSEKVDNVYARDYNSVAAQNSPFVAEGDAPPRTQRKPSHKKKTHSAWTKFMMWLRTRFLRMSRS